MALSTASPPVRARAASLAVLPAWPGWARLPRDARDTLFLLGVIGWTVMPHLVHLPVWCAVLTVGVLAWRARLALVNGALPGRWVLVGTLLAAAGLTLMSYQTLLGKEPGVTMAVVLMALKTLELRARRDAFVVFFLGFFLILTHFLYSQSLLVALAMLVSVWGLLTALVLAHMPVGQPSLRQAGLLSARTALLGAPIMALLFVLFPRIGPLWGVPQDGISKTGLSNTMRMGSVAEVAQDDSVAMRLRFDGPVPAPEAMYFRGPVLSRFDGIEWRPAAPAYRPEAMLRGPVDVQGVPVRYEMTLEPLRIAALPLLEATTRVDGVEGYRVLPIDGLQWLAERPLNERLRFSAEAYPRFRHGPLRMTAALQDELALPPGFNPRTLAWAADWRRQQELAQADARTLASALLAHIANTGYSYTLAAGVYGRDAVDEFWLDRKEGFCEHFAAAFVVVMRALGVPARIVTGYQGTEPDLVDGYLVVRQSSAHAWAEYWQAGIGWIRADPTAAVAPDRIQRSRRLLPAPGFVAGAIGGMSPAFLAQLRDGWEAVNNRWNQWVLNYTRGRQFDLLKRLGVQSPDWQDLAMAMIAAISTLAGAGAAWAWWDRHRIDPWARQMLRLRRALGALGVDAAAFEPPRSLAARLRARFGVAGDELAALLDQLDRQRYGRDAVARPDAALTRQFVNRARRLRMQGTTA